MAARPWVLRTALVATLGLALAACGSSNHNSGGGGKPGSITLYTSVTQNTVNAVVAGFDKEHPGAKVNVFRAPTGQLNARIAADKRNGSQPADVVWATDPLSMHGYETQGLLATWTPSNVNNVPPEYRTSTFWGTRLLYVVMVVHKGVTPVPSSWADLASPAYAGSVAIPDPAFAGSALAALGYFEQTSGPALDYYRKLKANGAVQVSSIDDVVNEVAQGRYKVGITLDNSARIAIGKGSPITMVWPSPGAIAVYSPIGTFADSHNSSLARAFVEYVLSPAGQRAIGKTGWTPILPGSGGPMKPEGAEVVTPNWPALFTVQAALLQTYQKIFGQ
jgi:iron(III) transport system substrate-binding protein